MKNEPFVLFADVKPGDQLVCDGGFTCLKEGDIQTVRKDEEGHLYIDCADGGHWLNGQLDRRGHLVGLWRA